MDRDIYLSSRGKPYCQEIPGYLDLLQTPFPLHIAILVVRIQQKKLSYTLQGAWMLIHLLAGLQPKEPVQRHKARTAAGLVEAHSLSISTEFSCPALRKLPK